jgi:hypothetical protein
MAILNPLGLLNNDPLTPVRVEDVESGLACNCYCAKCGAKFVAVQPQKRQWHFRHHNADDCGGSFETAVHLMAKQVLVKMKCLMLPYLKVMPSRELWKVGTYLTQEETLIERKRMQFDRVEDEVLMNGRIPDIVMWKATRKLLVEIVVTNPISQEKLDWIRQHDLATIQANLSWARYDISTTMIAQCLRDGRMVNCTPRKNIVHWVHHPWLAAAQTRVNDEYLKSIKTPASDQLF